MKRYKCILFCIVISLISLSGCGSEDYDQSVGATNWEPSAYEIDNNLDGVTMGIKEGTVSTTKLTVIFENNSEKDFIFGEQFLLEKNIMGSWYQVPVILDDNYGFIDIGYDLAPLDITEWTVDWGWLYGNLDTGEYRIVKEILDFRETGDYDKYILTAEFKVD